MMSTFMFPIYLATNKNSLEKIGEERKQLQKRDRGTWYQERPTLGHNRPERGKTNSQ